jgi:Na+-translocating ferredoxin:NAD+ oxidoreductase RnfC subunit
MNLVELVKQAGVIGVAGGGFPTHVTLGAKADTLIARGAEGEPLPRKGAVITEEEAPALVRGIMLAADAVEAVRMVTLEACDGSQAAVWAAKMKRTGPMNPKPHPRREGRRIPIQSPTRKLHLAEYDLPAPCQTTRMTPSRFVLPPKQSAGTPCLPKVTAGDRVKADRSRTRIRPSTEQRKTTTL